MMELVIRVGLVTFSVRFTRANVAVSLVGCVSVLVRCFMLRVVRREAFQAPNLRFLS